MAKGGGIALVCCGGVAFLEIRNFTDLLRRITRGIWRSDACSFRWNVALKAWSTWSNLIVTMYFSCLTILPTVPVMVVLWESGMAPQRRIGSPLFMGVIWSSSVYLSSQMNWGLSAELVGNGWIGDVISTISVLLMVEGSAKSFVCFCFVLVHCYFGQYHWLVYLML